MRSRLIRHLLRLKPPYHEARRKLRAAIESGQLSDTAPYQQSVPRINTILGGDSLTEGPDWVELDMWAHELKLNLKEVRDFVRLLETIDSRYESK